jgi:hypothetical protein
VLEKDALDGELSRGSLGHQVTYCGREYPKDHRIRYTKIRIDGQQA